MSTSQLTDEIDILVPLITYLGAHPYWWARSSPSLAQELSLDAERVAQTFARFPVLTDTQILSLIEFLLKISTRNASIRTSRLGAMIAVGAAILSSVAALAPALVKTST